jgi:hypothetical protein
MNGPESFAAVVVASFAGATVFILARAVARRIEGGGRQPAAIPAETTVRIERMERAIESVAIEIERISESQRFLTKVMTDRERAALPRGVTLE